MNATRIILKWSSYSSHYTAVHASLCICSVGARAEMPVTIFLMMVERRVGHFGDPSGAEESGALWMVGCIVC